MLSLIETKQSTSDDNNSEIIMIKKQNSDISQYQLAVKCANALISLKTNSNKINQPKEKFTQQRFGNGSKMRPKQQIACYFMSFKERNNQFDKETNIVHKIGSNEQFFSKLLMTKRLQVQVQLEQPQYIKNIDFIQIKVLYFGFDKSAANLYLQGESQPYDLQFKIVNNVVHFLQQEITCQLIVLNYHAISFEIQFLAKGTPPQLINQGIGDIQYGLSGNVQVEPLPGFKFGVNFSLRSDEVQSFFNYYVVSSFQLPNHLVLRFKIDNQYFYGCNNGSLYIPLVQDTQLKADLCIKLNSFCFLPIKQCEFQQGKASQQIKIIIESELPNLKNIELITKLIFCDKQIEYLLYEKVFQCRNQFLQYFLENQERYRLDLTPQYCLSFSTQFLMNQYFGGLPETTEILQNFSQCFFYLRYQLLQQIDNFPNQQLQSAVHVSSSLIPDQDQLMRQIQGKPILQELWLNLNVDAQFCMAILSYPTEDNIRLSIEVRLQDCTSSCYIQHVEPSGIDQFSQNVLLSRDSQINFLDYSLQFRENMLLPGLFNLINIGDDDDTQTKFLIIDVDGSDISGSVPFWPILQKLKISGEVVFDVKMSNEVVMLLQIAVNPIFILQFQRKTEDHQTAHHVCNKQEYSFSNSCPVFEQEMLLTEIQQLQQLISIDQNVECFLVWGQQVFGDIFSLKQFSHYFYLQYRKDSVLKFLVMQEQQLILQDVQEEFEAIEVIKQAEIELQKIQSEMFRENAEFQLDLIN